LVCASAIDLGQLTKPIKLRINRDSFIQLKNGNNQVNQRVIIIIFPENEFYALSNGAALFTF